MITTTYNPSPLELEIASIIVKLKDEIEGQLSNNKIVDVVVNDDKDNPDVLFKMVDNDGDRHELVIKLIQRADQHLV